MGSNLIIYDYSSSSLPQQILKGLAVVDSAVQLLQYFWFFPTFSSVLFPERWLDTVVQYSRLFDCFDYYRAVLKWRQLRCLLYVDIGSLPTATRNESFACN